MARLQTFLSKHLQNKKESEMMPSTAETYHHFWSGNKYNQVTGNLQGEICQVIKVDKNFKNASSITLLNSLCDISHGNSASIFASLSLTDTSKDDLNNKIHQQSHQLKEAAGLCVRGMTPDNAMTLSEIFETSSVSLLTNETVNKNDEFIYTCQCHENYGYENCTAVDSPNINGISAGNTYCQTVDQVSLNAGDDSNIIFIDHVVFGRPKFWTTDPLNVVMKLLFILSGSHSS